MILLYVVVSPKIHFHGAIGWLVPRGALGSLVPVEAMLVVLAIPPILVNTYAGVQGVDPEVRDAAQGMGMSSYQVVTSVELPIALPLIMAGVRSSVLQVIATATIAGYLPFLGGLGYQIFINGLPQINNPHVGYPAMLGAAVMVAVLAVVAELLLLGVQKLIVSPGLTGSYGPKRGAKDPAADTGGRSRPLPSTTTRRNMKRNIRSVLAAVALPVGLTTVLAACGSSSHSSSATSVTSTEARARRRLRAAARPPARWSSGRPTSPRAHSWPTSTEMRSSPRASRSPRSLTSGSGPSTGRPCRTAPSTSSPSTTGRSSTTWTQRPRPRAPRR